MRELLRRALGILIGVILLAAALVFASVILAVAAALAMVIGAWLWWRTRGLRRAAREGIPQAAAREGASSVVIEGEYRVEAGERRIEERKD